MSPLLSGASTVVKTSNFLHSDIVTFNNIRQTEKIVSCCKTGKISTSQNLN